MFFLHTNYLPVGLLLREDQLYLVETALDEGCLLLSYLPIGSVWCAFF